MQRRYGVKILLTAVIVLTVGLAGPVFFDQGQFPFSVHLRDARTAVVKPIPGVPLPDGLRSGDQINLPSLSLPGRLAMNRTLTGGGLPVGREYVLAVAHDQTVVNVPVTSTSFSNVSGSMPIRIVATLLKLFLAVVALLALWRGRDQVALGLTLWAVPYVIDIPLLKLPADGMAGLGISLGNWVLVLLARVGFYVMAESVAGIVLSRRMRLWWRAAFLVLLAMAAVQTIGGSIALVTTGWAALLQARYGFALPGCYLLAVALLFVSYRHAETAQRPRLRWMLGSGAIFALGILLADFANSHPYRALILAYVVLQMGGIAGFLYAALRHRFVDLKVVLNRAMVYAATTSLVLGLFALFESVVTRMALGKGASLVLELGVPLALGASLSTVHRRVDGLIDRLVFRRQYQEDLALREFGRECAFVTQPDKLLDLTVDQVSRYTEAPWVALYEPGPAGYERVRQCGERSLPATLGADDLALVKLRTHGTDLDLHGTDSSLGREGYAFPLRMRDKLMGVLVLGPRPSEHYSAEERELLAHVAHQVGAALFALRAEASELSLREARTHAQTAEASLREARDREQALLEALRNAGAAPST